MSIDEGIAGFDEGADGGGGSVEDGDAVFFNHAPEAAEVGVIGSTFIHYLGGTHGQWAVNDVGVAGDPANVRSAPIDVVIAHVEDVFAGGIGAGEVAA